MYEFISYLKDNDELIKQIKKQTNLGFKGYYEKEMLQGEECITYTDAIPSNRKKAIQLITPKQSLFTLVGDKYENECSTLLGVIYNRSSQENLNDNKDIKNCVNLGNICITEENTDISIDEKTGFLHTIIKKLYSTGERELNIYIPSNINGWQLEEVYKTRRIIEKYSNKFMKNDSIQVYHYKNFEKPETFKGEEAMRYLVEELPNYLNESIRENDNEQIIN